MRALSDNLQKVVLLIDYDNLRLCAERDAPRRGLDLPAVIRLAQRYGTLVVARAYSEWNLPAERVAVYNAGIEPVFTPVHRVGPSGEGKSLADTALVADGVDLLWMLAPQVLVLATSDKDLIPLVRTAKQRGVRVVLIGSDLTALQLRELVDEWVPYRQLAEEAVVLEIAAQYRRGAPPPAVARERERVRPQRAATPHDAAPVAPAAPAVHLTPGQPESVPSTDEVQAEDSASPEMKTVSTAAHGRRRRRRSSRGRTRPPAVVGEAAAEGSGESAAVPLDAVDYYHSLGAPGTTADTGGHPLAGAEDLSNGKADQLEDDPTEASSTPTRPEGRPAADDGGRE